MVKESPDPRWPGQIEMPTYMSFPQLFKWETAMNEAKKVTVAQKTSDTVTTSDFYLKLLKDPARLDVLGFSWSEYPRTREKRRDAGDLGRFGDHFLLPSFFAGGGSFFAGGASSLEFCAGCWDI